MSILHLTRTLALTNPLMHGEDVRQVQVLLKAKGFPCAADGVFGHETGTRCVDAKKRLRFPREKWAPSCGQPLVDALERHAPFPPLPLPTKRQAFVAELRALNAARVPRHYAQVRPINAEASDCSGSITIAAQRAGCPDPNGRGFDGEGYTGTMLSACRHITRSLLRPGDLAVFGSFPGHHVIAFLGGDSWYSMGHEGDPGIYTFEAQAAQQSSIVTFLSFLP